MTDVEIANIALTRLGAERITALDEDTESARKILAVYEAVRDDLLRDHLWNFAIKRASLAQLSETPEFGYSYKYQLPTDCLRVIGASDPDIEYKKEGKTLLCNENALKIKYVARITDPAMFDSQFVMVFAAKLAAEIAYAITGSATQQQECEQEFKEKLLRAMATDAMEDTPDEIEINTWIDSRE